MRLTEITIGPEKIAALRKGAGDHKYGHGHALVLSGGAGRTGAARLSARASLRIGAGLVTIGAPADAMAEVAAQVTAIMLQDASDVAEVLEDGRINAVCIGPGFGVGARCRQAVTAALQADRACVLDADVFSSFAECAEDLFTLTRGARCVLTPHEGEFSRLFPDLDLDDRAAACCAAAQRAGCAVVLKGPATVVGERRVAVHNSNGLRDAPWLATAGSGDVLAGMICGLLARGWTPGDAAEAAVWLHAEGARVFGPGLTAEDLVEVIPEVFRRIGV
ncbi:NAD(P)H-hydrate dehydratase [Pseudooceanicola sp. MF1-13]|uniref:NAD(P)H-hydrate dehydratase n=1 Tax=Pseudooceanicola sp. MF1-13 TaxID=3379095 RepID=UPI00389268A4